MNHYRCYRCFLPRSGREIITNTIKFIPQKIQFPNINIEKKLENLFIKISDILQSNVTQIPIKPMKYQALQHTIKYLAKVFNNHHAHCIQHYWYEDMPISASCREKINPSPLPEPFRTCKGRRSPVTRSFEGRPSSCDETCVCSCCRRSNILSIASLHACR